jgi:hypothetical protein
MEKLDIEVELQGIRQLRQAADTMLVYEDESKEDCWVIMIRELVDVAGYTYSRIARRINVSASTIQKLATQPGRKPRQNVFFRLMCLYYRVFYGPYRSPQIVNYVAKKPECILNRVPQALFNDH